MPYVRCDKDCKPVAKQPGHYDVSQNESCLVYENYNLDYIRTDKDCKPAVKQPAILDGWNEDYIRTKLDGTQILDLSRQFVQQLIYQPRNVKNEIVEYICYNHAPLNVKTRTIDIEKIYLASEDGADYFFEDEDGNRIRIELEINTIVDKKYLSSNGVNTDMIDATGNWLVAESYEYILDEYNEDYINV